MADSDGLDAEIAGQWARVRGRLRAEFGERRLSQLAAAR